MNAEMNRTFEQLYHDYQNEMRHTLALLELMPRRFTNETFVRNFEKKVGKLDTLIGLYRFLMSARQEKATDYTDRWLFLN